MKEHIIRSWCDRCEYLGQPRAEARHTYTVGVVKGETRPSLKVIEFCDECDAAEISMMAKMLTDHAIPLDPKAAAPARPAPARPAPAVIDRAECRICHKMFMTSSLLTHVWSQHRADQTRPEPPTRCPECRKMVSKKGMGVHRALSHGHSALDEAYEGLL